ncbi:MAG: cobalamin-binding protein [Casimicrobiaceae bacterium]
MRTYVVLFTLAMLAPIAAQAAVVARDDAGVTITLPRPAQRIVSLAPHATELLYAAGAGAAIVGTGAHSDWPPEARALPRVGDSATLDLERIVALAPDLIVTWPYTATAQLAQLRALGLPVFTTNPHTIAGIADDMERLAVLAGTGAQAAPAIADLRGRIRALGGKRKGVRIVRVFYQLGERPMYTIGGAQLITEALKACGGENVFGALALPAPLVGVEAVLAARPEAIIAGTDDARRPAWLDEWRAWPALPAVRAGNLYTADAYLLHRPGPRFIAGAEQLCATLDQARAALAAR